MRESSFFMFNENIFRNMNNIIDSIKVSGVTYEIQGSGGGITIDPTLDSGSTNPVANSAITTALDAKVNVADNEVSGVTVVTAIGVGEEFAYGKVNKITVKSTVSGGSGTRTVIFYCISSNGLSSICSLKYQFSNRTITSITSTSGNFTATLNNGAIDITFSSGYSFNFLYTSDSRFAVYGYMVYDGGQSADVLEGSVGQAITDVAAKIPSTILTDASLSISNSNGNISLIKTDQVGSNVFINRPLYDRKTLKYNNADGLYVNFYGETAHTVTLNTNNGNYCMIPDVASSYKDGLDSITVRVNSGYTGSTSSFTWKLNGVDYSGTTYENTYTYDKTNNTVALSGSSTFNVSVTNDGYYFTFTPTDTNTRIWRFYETNCNIAGIENIYQERYIIDLVQALTYQYNGQEVIDDIYSKLEGGGGGGKAIEAGRGISVTTGETADTVSFNLPISAGTGNYSIIEGDSTSAMSYCDHAEGYKTYAKGSGYAAHAEGYQTSAMTPSSHAEGRSTKANGNYAHAEGYITQALADNAHAEGYATQALANNAHTEGYYTTASTTISLSGIDRYTGYEARHAEGCQTFANNGSTHVEGCNTFANNFGEHASGIFNVSNSASTTFGDSGNTLFSVGNGTSTSARHNAFEIRQDGSIFITSGGTDIKLQDHLGGGGASYSAGTGIDITNNVISVSGVVETSAITTAITSSSTDSEIPSAKAVYDIVGDIETLLSQI